MHNPTHSLSVESLLGERGWMRSLALSLLKDAHGADEVVQEAVLVALRRPPGADRPLRPWLRTVLRRTVWRRLERDRHRAAGEAQRAFAAREESAPSAAELTERLELERLLVELLGGLEEPFRGALYQRFFEGLEPSEIARREGVPAGTLRWRLSRGLELLRDRLDARHGGDRRAWTHGLVPLLTPHIPVASLGAFVSVPHLLTQVSPAMKLLLLALPVAAAATIYFHLPGSAPPPSALRAAAPQPASPPAAEPAAEQAPPSANNSRMPVAVAETQDAPFTPALFAWAAQEMRAGWAMERSDPMPQALLDEQLGEFEELLRALPRYMGHQRAEERTQVESLSAHGRVFGILTELEQGRLGPQLELVSDTRAFGSLFEPQVRAGSVDARAALADPEVELVDGVTLTLPAGVFRLDRLQEAFRSFPRDVTIAGAGRDATLLVLGTLSTGETVRNLGFRDLTVHTDNNYLFDLRSKPAAVHMERVRLIGFDMGAGSSCAFGTRGLALFARDSIFEGGYGRSPQHGKIFDVRTDALMARFENCHFDLVALDLWRLRPAATVVFSNCRMTRLLDWQGLGNVLESISERPGLAAIGSTFEGFERRGPEGEMKPVPSKDLDQLFPGWRER